jgi:hypothetical protein
MAPVIYCNSVMLKKEFVLNAAEKVQLSFFIQELIEILNFKTKSN